MLDVVPFVPLSPAGETSKGDLSRAVAARDTFASWAGGALSLPCFLYGPLRDGTVRALPDLRRRAWRTLAPDTGPMQPHPSAGACAAGARGLLVAYNLWIEGGDDALVRRVSSSVRGPYVRALGFSLPAGRQVSCNLIEPLAVGPAEIHDAVAAKLEGTGASVARCELVGLAPAAVVEAVPQSRREELGLSSERTIEARLASHAARRTPPG